MKAFSLIEIVLALAIISFALVGILGLFPVAINAATQSQRETQAALIARTVFADLKSQKGPTRQVILGTNKSLITSGSDPRSTITVNLTEKSDNYLAYDTLNAASLPSSSNAGAYQGGNPEAGYLVKVSVSNENAPTDIAQIQVTVTSPGVVPIKARSSYTFASLLPNK